MGRAKVDSCSTSALKLELKQIKKLVGEEYCCVKKIRQAVHVSLPPSSIGKESKGVLEYLNSWKWQYNSLLHGIVLAFDKVSFITSLGTIIADQAFIHRDVEADFYVFQPTVGSILQGKINRISQSHVGCLVHNFINISIPLIQPVSSNLKPYLCMDETVLFEVTGVQPLHRFIRVHCKFTKKSIELMNEIMPKAASENAESVNSESEGIFMSQEVFPANESQEQQAEQSNESPSKHSKKKKKRKRNDETVNGHENTDDSGLASSPVSLQSTAIEESLEAEEETSSKKKKKKKRERTSV